MLSVPWCILDFYLHRIKKYSPYFILLTFHLTKTFRVQVWTVKDFNSYSSFFQKSHSHRTKQQKLVIWIELTRNGSSCHKLLEETKAPSNFQWSKMSTKPLVYTFRTYTEIQKHSTSTCESSKISSTCGSSKEFTFWSSLSALHSVVPCSHCWSWLWVRSKDWMFK